MKVYFVRHGRSIGNEKQIHQDSESKLSKNGLKQANLLSNRFKNIDIDLIITSSFIRAKQTAEIINKNLNKPIEESELFIELKRPTEIENLHILDEKVLKVRKKIYENYNDPTFRHSDEETFYELKERAGKAIKFLEEKETQNILVVSHGEFIRCMFGLMVFEDQFDSNLLLKIDEHLRGSNTGITLCEYEKMWKIITWNDITHLG